MKITKSTTDAELFAPTQFDGVRKIVEAQA